jgi:hypothetical protein
MTSSVLRDIHSWPELHERKYKERQGGIPAMGDSVCYFRRWRKLEIGIVE